MIIAPVLGDLMAILASSLISSITSITKSFLQALVKSTSPIPPSVMAGQKTGISFLQAQQQILSSLLISFPNRLITFLGVHLIPWLSCSLAILAKRGSRKDSNLMQLSVLTKILPILQWPFSLFSISFMLNSPRWKVPMHFIRSSSIPPAVVTMQSIILCCARYLMISLIPQETILEVQPKQIVHFLLALQTGSLVSSSSLSLMGSSESLQLIMLLTISIAWARWVAWKPVVAQLLKISSQLTPLLKSYPFTTLVSSSLTFESMPCTCCSRYSQETTLDSLLMFNNRQRIQFQPTTFQFRLHYPYHHKDQQSQPNFLLIFYQAHCIMKITTLLAILLYLALVTLQKSTSQAYAILNLRESASNSEVEAQYKRLRSKYRRNRIKKSMVRQAYDQILFERQFQTREQVKLAPSKPSFPTVEHIDQTYVYGYKLGDQFDDGRYFEATFNETQFIIERSLKAESNKKTAGLIVFIGSILFKLLPCILIFCLCRRVGGGGLQSAMTRARAGYLNVGRRGNARL